MTSKDKYRPIKTLMIRMIHCFYFRIKELEVEIFNQLQNNNLLNRFFNRIQYDPRIGATHIALFTAMVQMGNHNASATFYGRELRQLAKINSPRTYFKVLRDLQECEYIEYRRGVSRWEKSLAWFII